MPFDLSFQGYRIYPNRDEMQWFQLPSDAQIPKPKYLILTFLPALVFLFYPLSQSILYTLYHILELSMAPHCLPDKVWSPDMAYEILPNQALNAFHHPFSPLIQRYCWRQFSTGFPRFCIFCKWRHSHMLSQSISPRMFAKWATLENSDSDSSQSGGKVCLLSSKDNISRWMKKMQCINTMKYYSAIKKERNWVIYRDMDGPRVYHTEWSKSEREQQIH